MRQFASKGIRLWQLGTPAKVLYTGFAFFTLLGLLSSVLFFVDLMGTTPAGAARYYRGSAPVKSDRALPPSGGPEVELPSNEPVVPGDPSAADGVGRRAPVPMTLEVPYRKLVEVSHFHLFTVPVVLLIIAHLFMLTDLAEKTKVFWILLASAGSLLHLAAPWLVRYASARAGILMPTSGALMLGSMGVLTLYPVYAMWWGSSRRERPGAAPPEAGPEAG